MRTNPAEKNKNKNKKNKTKLFGKQNKTVELQLWREHTGELNTVISSD